MSYLTSYDEKELIRRTSEGDEKAFSELFHNYHQLLGVHIHRITKSSEITEEIVQDVFVKLWLRRDRLAEIEDLRAYLYVLSKNQALNALKQIAKEKAVIIDVNINLLEKYPSINDEISDYHSYIDSAIENLPPQQQLVYLLSRHEQLKYDEIATRMNISRETVKKYLRIATESIKSQIQKQTIRIVFCFIYIF